MELENANAGMDLLEADASSLTPAPLDGALTVAPAMPFLRETLWTSTALANWAFLTADV